MSSNQPLTIVQKMPFSIRKICIDAQSNKVRVVNKTLCKIDEYSIDIHEFHEDCQRTKRRAIGWGVGAMLMTLSCLGLLGMWNIQYVAGNTIIYYPFVFSVAVVISVVLWFITYMCSYDVLIYRSRFTKQIILSIFIDKPNQNVFRNFVVQFSKLIRDCSQQSDIRGLIHQISTDLLVNEFSNYYVTELMQRGIDVNNFLMFLQRKINNCKRHETAPTV
ncbi:MAG: hypothetical protein Tsb005_16200 [Gammaproteobacteria bacterium]